VDSKISYPGNTVDVYSTAVVAAPPTQTLATAGLSGPIGQPISGVLGAFTVGGTVIRPGDYRASIDWGDGTPMDTSAKFELTAPPPGTSVAYAVVGTHTYTTFGQFNVKLTVDTLGGGAQTDFANTVVVTTCSTPSPATSAYARAVLASQPAGYWRLDSACPADSSGHGLNGMPQGASGGITPGTPGAPALDVKGSTVFDGLSGAISLGDPAALQPSKVSVEAWVNSSHANGTVVRKRLYGYDLYLDGSGRPQFNVDDVNATVYAAVGPAAVDDGKWHYLVGTYDGSQVCLYVDGALAGSCAVAAPIHYAGDLVAIGRDGSANGGYFNGSIDDVAIYSRALTSTDVRAHFAAARQATSTSLTRSGQTLVATVTGADGITPTGSLSLEEGGTTLKTVNLDGGGTVTLPLTGLAAGTHSLVAVYSGDDVNSATSSSTPLSVSISAIATTTSVTTSNINAPHFASITLTATVQGSGSGVPTGSVTFMADGAVIGTGNLSNGVAAFTARPGVVTAGVHTITAVYAGDGKYGPSTSKPIKQIVQGNS
jgi:hypothetical protein